jgi:2-desacetyl-2-hydroxyethyl bacteriochlorophyllide A dehydrogenase
VAFRIVFTGKQQVELEDFELRSPRDGEVVVRSLHSLMSTGTENIAFNRNFDPGTHWDAWVRYPFRPGYLTVGVTDDTGELVFHRGTHASHHVIARERCTTIPDGVDARDATWCGLAKIAFSGLTVAGYRTGEDVVIVGAGPIGQMSVRWAHASGLASVTAVDVAPFRLELARRGGASHTIEATVAESGLSDVPLVIDTTGNADVLADCLRICGRFGKVVLLGDTGRPQAQHLTSDVITKGLTIVGTHDTHDRGGWPEPRVNAVFFELVSIGRFSLDGLITHVVDAREPAKAYELANTAREQTMGICFDWPQRA